MKLGASQAWGPYTLQFNKFERDPQAAAMAMSGVMPDKFPVWADMRVIYQGKSYYVQPQSITLRDNPMGPQSPEIALPGGALLSFDKMNAGSADSNAGGGGESGSFVIREPGPVMEAFQIDITTRPLINFVWLGTLLMVAGGLMSMRRRILENREVPIPDLPDSFPLRNGEGGAQRREGSVRAKRRAPNAKPAPSLATMRGKGR